MGTGRYKDGKFDMILSIRHDADETRILQWERSFRRASEILYDATDGQMQFGKLFVANNSAGSSEADAWLLEEEGTSSSFVDAFGVAGLHMNLKSDEKNKPFVIIHEFGHYGFGLYDEYTGPGGAAECTGSTDQGACIMEHGYWNGDQILDDGTLVPGPVNEFCTDENHDPDHDTNQQSIHGEPCWQTMHDNYPDILIPAVLPNAPVPAGHEDVEWIRLAGDPRFALVLDRSGSMSANNAISGVRYGADYWVNYLAQTGDSLSVVAYNQSQNVILPLTTLDPAMDLSPTLTSIAAINPSGTTCIGGAMQEGLDQICSPGDMAATQVMILFSDGLHNTGTSPEAVIDSVVEHGVRVYTIGFGPYADQVRLEDIAQATGGRFEQIDADADTPDAQLEIQNYLIEISGEVRDGSGIVTMMPGLLPEPAAAELANISKMVKMKYSGADLKLIEKLPLSFRARAIGFDHKAYIEEGSQRATFVVSYKEGTSVNFYLQNPDGSTVSPGAEGVTFINPVNSPYAFYVVDKPKPGYWVMRVVRGKAGGQIPFKVFAFSENKDITVGIKGIRHLYRVSDLIVLNSQVYNKVPLSFIKNPVATINVKRIKSTVGRPVYLKPQVVQFKQRLTRTDIYGKLLDKPVSLNNGVYEGQFRFDKPGSYSVTMEFVNNGKAMEAAAVSERIKPGEAEERPRPVPAFIRLKRFQLHVGPLAVGKDVEDNK